MYSFLGSRDSDSAAKRRLLEARRWIDADNNIKVKNWNDLQADQLAEQHSAALQLQQLFRGWLGRQYASDRRAQVCAANCLQRLWRGCLGRRIAAELLWARVSVVPTRMALQLMLARSRKVQQIEGWVEYYDADTGAFWYLDEAEHSTWDAPDCFQSVLTCLWDPWPYPYSSPIDLPCRKIFKSHAEYQKHRQTAHPWQCCSCEHINSAMTFPLCALCSNSTGPQGEDLVAALRTRLKVMLHESTHPELLRKVLQRPSRSAEAAAGLKQHDTDSNEDDSCCSDVDDVASLASDMTESTAAAGDTVAMVSAVSTKPLQRQRLSVKNKLASSKRRCTRSDSMAHSISNNKSRKSDVNQSFKRGMQRTTAGAASSRPVFGSSVGAAFSAIAPEQQRSTATSVPAQPTVLTRQLRVCPVFAAGRQCLTTCPLAHPGVRDSAVVRTLAPPRAQQRCAYNPTAKSSHANGSSSNSSSEGVQCVLVCEAAVRRMLGCSDAVAVAEHSDKLTDESDNAAAVAAADEDGCPAGSKCTHYHPYVRPSTQEIIDKVYKRRKGQVTRQFPSGSIQSGTLIDGELEGLATCTWPYRHVAGDLAATLVEDSSDVSVYFGQWSAGKRHGLGVYRSGCGEEYTGSYHKGRRHGTGVLRSSDGAQLYEGQFYEGTANGIGVLTSASGGTYEGQFSQGLPHGIGLFVKKNGDCYMGHVQRGAAHGVGVLTLVSGSSCERYKGEFVRDRRCGKGTCEYPSGARYSGYWVRDVYHGSGTLHYANGDHYSGQWRRGKKHQRGRYTFACGDTYEGDFVEDQACGKGHYRDAATGQTYTGGWLSDKRHGRGTVLFPSGAQYDGQWTCNSANGTGSLRYANGEHYSGTFVNSQRHGTGRYTWTDGTVYTGQFCRNVIEGTGELVCAPPAWATATSQLEDESDAAGDKPLEEKRAVGHRYVGAFVAGRKHGQGVLRYADGSVYAGEFREDRVEGKGKLTLNPGTLLQESYEGDWINGERHGIGAYTYRVSEGMVYTGQWCRGLRHGHGTLRFHDGSYYTGAFEREQKHGRGAMVWCDGTQYDGDWQHNERSGAGVLLGRDGSIFRGVFLAGKKHGRGQVTYLNGSSFTGLWHHDAVTGTKGVFTLRQGAADANALQLRVFGY